VNSRQRKLETLGEPALQIGGLRIWVHGREFPDAQDYWDGNWLRVTAYCLYSESRVWVDGPIIHLPEIERLLSGCERLYETLEGNAALGCLEPNLYVALEAQIGGRVKVEISITPDHLRERHSFEDAIDQTYLPTIIQSCKQILASLPIREPKVG